MSRFIYVASSWRNPLQETVVQVLREAGHEVYDFKNPIPGDKGFGWHEIDPDWQKWTASQFRQALSHPLVDTGFDHDMSALTACDVCVLVLPCGRSAHLECGWAVGAGKETYVLLQDGCEPEMMYRMLSQVCVSIPELILAVAAGQLTRPFRGPAPINLNSRG